MRGLDKELYKIHAIYGETLHEILDAFDTAYNIPEDKIREGDQAKINCLALLLTAIEDNADEKGNSTLDVPLICKIQALMAAYQLGKNT
jgi:hypothetical protein